MMKTLKSVAAIAFALTVAAWSQAQAQPNDATASADATATVVTPIAISGIADLNFAEVVASNSAGTVVMSTAGVRSATGGTTLGNGSGASAAAFLVTGDPGATYAITLPSTISLSNGSDNITVDSFISNPSGTGMLGDPSGQQTLDVGATLQVNANQPTGTYTGSVTVTVAYN